MIPKSAYETLKKQAAHIEAVDREAAAELGFAKAARDLGLDEAQYNIFRKVALAKLAEQEVSVTQETNAAELKPGTIAEGMDVKKVDEGKENVNKDVKTARAKRK